MTMTMTNLARISPTLARLHADALTVLRRPTPVRTARTPWMVMTSALLDNSPGLDAAMAWVDRAVAADLAREERGIPSIWA